MGEAAAYGAAAAQFAVADPGQRHGQQRHCGGAGVLLDLPLPDCRAHVQGVAVEGQLIQARYGVDVDEDGGAAEPHREDRDQRLASGQHLALIASIGQRGDRVGGRGRADIIKRRGLHGRLPAPEGGLALLREGGDAFGEVSA